MAPTIGAMLITDLPSADVDALRSRLYGEVYGPGDEGWDEARRAWNLAVDQRPAAVAFPQTDSDVVAVVNFAREEGLRVAPQGTGHGAARDRARSTARSCSAPRACAACGSTRGAASRASRRRAVGGRDRRPRRRYGLAPLAGSSHDVGVVGYTLGGGLSWLARSTGSRANSVTAIELVTADGEHRARRRRARPRPLLGAARRRRELRRRDRDGVRALPGRGAQRRRDAVAVGARRGDLQRLARVDAGPSRTRSPRCAGSCRSRRCPTSRRRCAAASWSSSRRRSWRPGPARAAARARARARHVRGDGARRPDRDPQRPEAARAGHERPPPAGRRPRRGDHALVAAAGRAPTRRSSRSSCATSAARSPTRSTLRVLAVRARRRRQRRGRDGDRRRARRADGRDGARTTRAARC